MNIRKNLIIAVTLLLATVLSNCKKNALKETVSDSRSNIIYDVKEVKFARILFEHTTYDFGRVKQGSTVTHLFIFKNDGDTSLIISNASASCGCTVPSWPKHSIAPGDTASIRVQFNTTGKSGIQNKSVIITANTLPNITTLVLKGEVEPPGSETP